MNVAHLSYVAFPLFYGALGSVLTAERWWLWVMLFLSFVRFATSALAIDPAQMAARHAHRVTGGSRGQRREQIDLAAIRGFILDMDGVLYRGEQVREGAKAFIEYLHATEIPYVCLTNNASRTSEMYQEKLDRLGLPIDSTHVLGAAQATAEWLEERAPHGTRVLPVGEAGLREELARAGFTVVDRRPAEYVIVGIDFNVTYEKLKEATLAIRGGADFVGTNPDSTFPCEEGLLPGNGDKIAYLHAATDV
jgi:4-nitrophenyl phosphatase